MSSDCENVSAQMMELLYGELPADARASVDAHVAGCARCRGELAGFEKTRALARRGLDEAPPARAHAAIMAAAAAHLAAQAQPAARKPAAPEKVSFWDRVRARWAFPTFATVGALAVFMIANRVFLNPERTLHRPPAAEPAEAPAPAAQTQPRLEPMPAPPPQAASAPEPAAASSPKAEHFAQEAQRGARAHHGKKILAAPADMPAGDAKPVAGKRDIADALEGLDSGGAGERRGGEKKAKKEKGGPGGFAEPPPPAMAAAPADKTAREQPEARQERSDRRFAPPPPPREEEAAPKPTAAKAPVALHKQAESVPAGAAASTKPATPAPSKSVVDLMRGEDDRSATAGGAGKGRAVGGVAGPSQAGAFGSGAAQAAPMPSPARNQAPRPAAAAPAPKSTISEKPSPPPPAAPVTASKARAKRSNAAPAADEGQETALDSEAKDEKKPASGRANPNEVLLQRADRLFAEGRWTEAAAVYRELLRRDPRSDDAERWRRRLVAAESAEVSERHNADLAERARNKAEITRSSKSAMPKAAKKAAPSKAASGDAAE